MLELTILPVELYDESTRMFTMHGEEVTIQLEHSLVSLSKWEQIWEKPFLTDDDKTIEETISYIKCMCLTPDVSSEVFTRLTNDHVTSVSKYIDKKMTATWFTEVPGVPKPTRKEIITAEIIYYWIIALQLPPETQHWHLNQLFTLVKVTNEKNTPKKNQPRPGRATSNANRRALMEARRQQYGTNG